MRRVILFAAASIAMMFCLAMTASAEYHEYTATAEINADVQIPILITAEPGTLDLGDLAPGVCRIFGAAGEVGEGGTTQPTGPSILFTINGAPGWPIIVKPTDPYEHNENPLCMDGKVTLDGGWYNSTINNSDWLPYSHENDMSTIYYLGGEISQHHAKCPTNSAEPGGNYYFKYVVYKMTATDDATVGTYRWELDLYAAYVCVSDLNFTQGTDGVVMPGEKGLNPDGYFGIKPVE